MTKIFKNVIITIFGMFAFLFAGFFFTACGVNYDKIQLVCDNTSIRLEVDETVDLTFTIENYQKGFSNKIDFNDQSSGLSEIFACSTPVYLDDDTIKVTITGLAGGNGKLEVRTLEAGKSCEVDIFVEQYSREMNSGSDVLYVSNKTPFIPSHNDYIFDSNTTNKELSYYFIDSNVDLDFNLFSLQSFSFSQDENFALFSDGDVQFAELPVVRFDRVELEKESGGILNIFYDGQILKSNPANNNFNFIAVYNHSLAEDGSVKQELYENIVHKVRSVNVLPDLQASVSGGYVEKGNIINLGDCDEKITIVPNNNEMNAYVLKVETATSIKNLPIDFKMFKSNEYVDIDFFREEDYLTYSIEQQENVFYLKITQNVQTQATTDFSFEIFYNIAQGVNDESVNVKRDFVIDVEIAPIDLLVNGTSTPENITLYNWYKFPDYGWNELIFDVISGLESSPNFDGIWFEYDSKSLELSCEGVNVSSGKNYLYSDLSKSFFIRGAYQCEKTEKDAPAELKVHLESDILSGEKTEIVLTMKFDIVAGSTGVWASREYGDVVVDEESGEVKSVIYSFDINDGEKNFYDVENDKGILLTDAAFQSISYRHERMDDVVDIVFDPETVCKKGEDFYYLNFNVIPKAVGSGVYTINLDNGEPITVVFKVIESLDKTEVPFVLTNEGNETVTNFAYSTGEFTDAALAGVPNYANILNVDIMNANNDGKIEFGSKFGLRSIANTVEDGVKFNIINGNINISEGENAWHFSTQQNGVVIARAILTGEKTNEIFKGEQEEIFYELRIASYSLLQDFYIKNIDTQAISNTVYYGGEKVDDKADITFASFVDNKQAFGFYKYDFTQEALVAAYEYTNESIPDDEGFFDYEISNDHIEYELDYDFYSDSYVYFYAHSKIGLFKPSIVATIKKNNSNGRKIRLEISNGLMFYANNREFETYDKDGNLVRYSISFEDRVFSDANGIGKFDIETMTYTNMLQGDYTLRLNAYVRQRNMTKQYEVRVDSEKYLSVESISLASSLNRIDFDNEMREFEIDVYTYPNISTGKNIEVVFVTTNGTPYYFVSSIRKSSNDAGLHSVKISCDDFFKNPKAYYTRGDGQEKLNVVDIEDSLTGKLYIFPSEWGSSISEIDSGLNPIVIDVQYRNGSKNNPYLIETAEDLRKINQNETTLKSHYEINTVIDMGNVTNFTPIGILYGEVKGFSGSIVGANSQATLANINISNNNFVESVGNVLYGGLFAQLNESALIENVAFTGSFALDLQKDAYLGLLASINRGTISNVGVKIDASKIDYASTAVGDNEGETLYFGGITGINVGSIIQNFNLYDSYFDTETADMADYVGYHYKKDDAGQYEYENGKKIKLDDEEKLLPENRDLTGQTPKILVYFNDFVVINVDQNIVYAGGIAGASGGTIQRCISDKNTLQLYGYSKYSAYSLIKFAGSLQYGLKKEVNAGGAVGIATFNVAGANASSGKLLPIECVDLSSNKLDNLLIGGEIDTSEISGTNWFDYVGGVVGFVDSVDSGEIKISNNISRVFLRAHHYVGGIVGYETDSSSYGDDLVVNYLNNTLEAIDDGRQQFYGSMIIKMKNLDSEPVVADPATVDGEAFYFVGSALINFRADYVGSFKVCSYVKRDLIDGLHIDDVLDEKGSSTGQYYGDYLVAVKSGSSYLFKNQFVFHKSEVSVGLDLTDERFKMTKVAGTDTPNVYFMYYFSVDGFLNSDLAVDQSAVESLNKITPDSVFYPFILTNGEVTMSSLSSNILSIDLNGVITVKNPGMAIIELRSIKNTNTTTKIYVYVVNYFDKSVDKSLFYSSQSSNATNLTNNSLSVVYGDSKTNVYMVPTYDSAFYAGFEDLKFSISKNGILKFENVDYVLTKNSQLGVLPEILSTDNFSKVEIVGQKIVFSKESKTGDLTDSYSLTPMLQTTFKIGDETFTYQYSLDTAEITIDVEYRDKATAIYTDSDYVAIKSNGHFSDSVTIESTNPDEMVFYQIFYNGELVQNRLPKEFGEIASAADWEKYIHFEDEINSNSLKFFDIDFSSNHDNSFDFVCSVNQASDRFASRFMQEIYGEYVVHLYASDLGQNGGVSSSFVIDLTEAGIDYVAMKNYSNMADVSVSDDKLVPSQRGLLEINIDPVEAVFDQVVVSNSELNYMDGANEASLTFVYQKITDRGVEFVSDPNFGTYKNGALSFEYSQLIQYFEDLNESFKDKGESARVEYTGRIYVSYYMPSVNVGDMIPVGFDVKVTYGADNFKPAFVKMTTKLGNYAKLSFDDKQAVGDVYYVARGLSYGLTLDSHGFEESEISISSSNDSLAKLSGSDGKYTLEITKNDIPYQDEAGCKIEVETLAKKFVDDIEIITRDVLTIYIMEYVLDYNYVPGVYEDLVKGMQDGVISSAVGNPYTLEFDVYDFLEFDKNNSDVVKEVVAFANEMTKKISWKVHYKDTAEELRVGKEQFRTEYYSINGLVVTPLKVYSADSDIYHFSMDAYYTMRNGIYTFSPIATENRVYTEFEFDVHDQSTEDSPIPIYNYQEFLKMEAGQWYILLNDIVLPSEEGIVGTQQTEFKPLSVEIAGLDGNNKKIIFGGTYNFSELNRVGLFDNIASGTIVKNVTISLANDTVFKMDTENFEVGLLTAENDGVITNCVVENQKNSTLSVVSTTLVENSFVAGLVSTNNAYITHSRSKINIFTNANLSGFVATNGLNGVIASSYFKGGMLKNETNTSEKTAGFVIVNNGRINTSYVSGETDAEQMYYFEETNADDVDVIMSSFNIAGFAYSNAGNISDCYSNILLKQSGAFAAGFVFENAGAVSRCFSTSVFESEQSSNYGFARENINEKTDEENAKNGTIVDCFYLQDEERKINTSIGEIVVEDGDDSVDLQAISVEEFAKLEEYFAEYVYAEGRNPNAVWFFNNDKLDRDGFGSQIFNTGRLELVAPNLIATSERVLDRVESVTDEVGATYSRYIYVYETGSAALGGEENPITITSAEDFEEYIVQENNKADYNFSYYRIVADIDYNDYIYNSQTYKTKFMGYLEGNFMTIDGITYISSQSLKTAGMFAEIGSSAYGSIGTVMNLSIKPNAVSFANASVAGTLAGKLDCGTIVNVSVELQDDDPIVAVGQNIVGGAIGLALGDYTIENLYSQIGAKARNQKQDASNNTFNSMKNDYTFNSFAGSVVGVLSGQGEFVNGVMNTPTMVLADKAGLLFGLVDSGAKVSQILVEMNEENVINAYSYGGLVAGESKGEVKKVEVKHFDKDSGKGFTNFRRLPFVAEAVGGFAGLVSGGNIKDLIVEQDIVICELGQVGGIKYLGGVAGAVENAPKFENINVSANLTGYDFVGGVIGLVSSVGEVVLNDVNVKSELKVLSSRVPEVGLGGIAAEASRNSRIVLSYSRTNGELDLGAKCDLERLYNFNADVLREEYAKLVENSSPTDEWVEKVNNTYPYTDADGNENKNLGTLIKEEYDLVKDKIALENAAHKDEGAIAEKQSDIELKKTAIDAAIGKYLGLNRLKRKSVVDKNLIEVRQNQILSALDSEKAAGCNNIDITVSTNLNVYSQSIQVYTGAIVGKNDALLEHVVSNSLMSIVGVCTAYDNGNPNVGDSGGLAIVNESWDLHIEQQQGSKIAERMVGNAYNASNSAYICDVKFVTTNTDIGNVMYLSVFGNAYSYETIQ